MFLQLLRSETAASPERRTRALAGLAAYQAAARVPRTDDRPVVAQCGRITLRAHGGAGRPLVVVPSLVNPPHVLDLAPGRSLLDALAAHASVHQVDWGSPTPADAAQDIAGHVEALLALIAALPGPPVLVGYCLGGTMALAAACCASVAGLATIASPWHFTGFGDEARRAIARQWSIARAACESLGLVPMEVLQAGFWQLDAARLIAKFEAFADLAPESEAAASFLQLEDWANGGAPLTLAAGRDLFERFIAGDTPGGGGWHVAGQAIGPERLACAAIDFVSTTDRIVPAASAARLSDTRCLALGHVGMIVGGRARAQLWDPLGQWIAALP